MTYYVLSATQSEDCPISLVEDGVLYANKEQISDDFKYGYLPWYRYRSKNDKFDLPKNGVLLLKSKNIKLSFRNIVADIYVVNEDMKDILEKYIKSNFIAVHVLNSNLEKYDDLNYYIFRFDYFLNFNEVVNLDESSYIVDEDDWIIVENIKILDGVDESLFKINKIDLVQNTFFINENVKNEIEKIKPIGIKFFEVDRAKWSRTGDFSFLFLSPDEISKLVWAV